jgi:hypothetical protein
MSMQSAIGKQSWRDRAPAYRAELRTDIEQRAGARYAGWQERGRPPLWFRIKRWLRALPDRARAWVG